MIQSSPYKYFKTSPEILRLADMLYVRFPLAFRNVEDPLHERGVDVNQESVRYLWHHFGPMIAAEIQKLRIKGSGQVVGSGISTRGSYRVMVSGITFGALSIMRAVDHVGGMLESFPT